MSIGKYSVVKLKELQLGDVATDLTFSQNVILLRIKLLRYQSGAQEYSNTS